jgi:hypothetical protein
MPRLKKVWVFDFKVRLARGSNPTTETQSDRAPIISPWFKRRLTGIRVRLWKISSDIRFCLIYFSNDYKK